MTDLKRWLDRHHRWVSFGCVVAVSWLAYFLGWWVFPVAMVMGLLAARWL